MFYKNLNKFSTPKCSNFAKKPPEGTQKLASSQKKTTCQHLDPQKKISRQWHIQISSCITPNPPKKNWPTILQYQSLKNHKKKRSKHGNNGNQLIPFVTLLFPELGGHLSQVILVGYLTIPKRSQRIARPSCCQWLVSLHRKKSHNFTKLPWWPSSNPSSLQCLAILPHLSPVVPPSSHPNDPYNHPADVEMIDISRVYTPVS